MANGVTTEGFIRPRLPEIRLEIIEALVGRLRAIGYTGTIETRPDSLFGLLIDTFAERETALWEQTEAVYYAMYPSSASGAQLDRAASFTGVARLGAEKSQVFVVLYGQDGTIVPALSQIRNRVTQSLWEISVDTAIGTGAVADVSIRPIPASNATYTVTIDGVDYSFTSDPSATLAEILAGIVGAVSASGFDVSSDGAIVRVHGDGRETFVLQLTANLDITSLGSSALARSVEFGALTAAENELTEIVTLVPGWARVDNLQDAALGRLAETDAELRTRYKSGVYALGAATLPALQANLESRVAGAQTVRVFENDTDLVDTLGRPPHSIHVVIEGGLDTEIAETIFNYKAAGIDTHGAIELEVIDAEGIGHDIRFDRPTPRYIWISAELTLLPAEEEVFPPDGFTRIAANLLAEGNTLGVGQDVIWQRLLRAVYLVPGVAHVNMLLAVTASAAVPPLPGDYVEANITIADFEVSRFDLSRIEVF
jgi:uncharacterized phage protein gp47/JayE